MIDVTHFYMFLRPRFVFVKVVHKIIRMIRLMACGKMDVKSQK